MHVFIVEFWLKISAIQKQEQAPVPHSQEWAERQISQETKLQLQAQQPLLNKDAQVLPSLYINNNAFKRVSQNVNTQGLCNPAPL